MIFSSSIEESDGNLMEELTVLPPNYNLEYVPII